VTKKLSGVFAFSCAASRPLINKASHEEYVLREENFRENSSGVVRDVMGYRSHQATMLWNYAKYDVSELNVFP
jgi:hypothetical protein